MLGTLYIVATPLGNLEDQSPRASRVLEEVDLLACEDTRHTRKLLSHFGIQTPTTSYHEHNQEEKASELLGKLMAGRQVALVCDAGTPLVSDPGYRLVQMCREKGIPVVPIPGPSAAIAALSVSGLPSDRFLFVGFLPRRPKAQRDQLKQLVPVKATLIFYLSPYGLSPTLAMIEEVLGNRKSFLIREMTKVHETSYCGSLQEISRELENEPIRGEYTLVVEKASTKVYSTREMDVAAYVAGLVARRGVSQKDATKAAARELGLSKQQVYKLVTGSTP